MTANDLKKKKPMIERLHKFAKVLSRVRFLLLVMTGLCAGFIALSLIDNPWLIDDRWLPHSFTGLLWFLMLYALSHLFLQLPPPAESALNWWQRVLLSVRWSMMWLLGMLFLSLSVSLILLSYRLLFVAYIWVSLGNVA